MEVALSILSYGSIYISLQSGLDIVSLLKSLGASEATLAKLPSAEAGYHALAFICYKVSLLLFNQLMSTEIETKT